MKPKSIRLTTGIRSDNIAVSTVDPLSGSIENQQKLYSTSRLEFIYDNSLNPAMNIWNGLRYKVFIDWNRQVSKLKFSDGPNTFNLGFDARYYYPIYRNFIWALVALRATSAGATRNSFIISVAWMDG